MSRTKLLQLQAGDLPNGFRNPLVPLIHPPPTHFPDDAAFRLQQNRRELLAKAPLRDPDTKQIVRPATPARSLQGTPVPWARITRVELASLDGETLDVEYVE
jgi:hypothetical protein